MTSVALSSDGISICFEVHGTEGSPLVLVHGWSCDRGYWRGQVEHFARGHRVVTVDLAGHGESGLGRERWTMPAFGDDVAAVVEKLDLDNVVLVGHSMGGDVIVETALRLRGRIAGLVWVDVYSKLGDSGHRDADAFMEPFRQTSWRRPETSCACGCARALRTPAWSSGSQRTCRPHHARSPSTRCGTRS